MKMRHFHWVGPTSRSEPARRMLLPPAMLPGAFAIVLIGGAGPNLLLALLSVAVLIVGCMLLWRPGESPVLLFVFAYPWLQGSIAIYHANWLGIDIVDYAPFHGDMHTAVVMSLAGVLALAVGMRLAAGPRRAEDVLGVRETALSQPMRRWFRLYAMAWAIGFLALSFAWVLPGLSQPLLALAALRWAFFFMLAFAYFLRGRDGGRLFPLVFLFELATGIGGYFSDFKTVFFMTLFAALASGVRVAPKALLGSGALLVVAVALGIVWTAVKGEFRTFVAGGQAEQIVTVDYVTRLAKLHELVANLNLDALTDGTDRFLRRVTYVEFFSVVLVNVPAYQPHTSGAIFGDAITRVFMPRLLFVDKDVVDDTARTNLYTGGLAGSSEGTSISLGYIAEAYIDFGAAGMFAALVAIGLFYGTIYRIPLRWRRSRGLLGIAMATAVLTSVGPMETSFTKLFAGVIVSLLAAWLVVFLAVPRWAPWLVAGRS
jgi:hypothetical protein